MVVRAEGGADLLVWLFIALIWTVIQVVARLAQRRTEDAGQPVDEEAPQEDRLARIIREITGVKVEVPVPVPPEEAAHPIPARTSNEVPRTESASQRKTAGGAITKSPPKKEFSDEGSVRRYPRKTAPTALITMPMPRAGIGSFASLNVPITPVPPTGVETVFKGRYRPEFRGRDDLRQAVVAAVILGPPVALRPPHDPFSRFL
ncbi:MAG: hypothetical protein DRP22_00510 [Verrucomicrobia bacterium]|nr:MAG: hypothetical protein DRP22_00510 [Verrucomicrobiota bacterium]